MNLAARHKNWEKRNSSRLLVNTALKCLNFKILSSKTGLVPFKANLFVFVFKVAYVVYHGA